MVLGVSELTTKFVKIFTFAVVAVLFYKHEITVGVGVATLSYVSSFIEPIDTVLYNFTAIQSMKDVKKKVLAYTQDTHVTVLPRKEKFCIGKYKFNNKKRHEVCRYRTQRSRKINLVQTYYGV